MPTAKFLRGILLLAGAMPSCAPGHPAPPFLAPAPVPGGDQEPARERGRGRGRGLPAVEPVHGPLGLTVVYPVPEVQLDPQDTTFVYGSAGNGLATVTVNGVAAEVWPNGAWIAWAPPRTRRPGEVVFDIRAALGGDTVRVTHSTRERPRYHPPLDGSLWADTLSMRPRGEGQWPEEEPFVLSVRATPGATVALRLAGGTTIPFVEGAMLAPVSEGFRNFDRDPLRLLRDTLDGVFHAVIGGEPLGLSGGPPTLLIARGVDTLRVPWPLRLERIGRQPPVVLDDDPRGGGDGLTPGRAVPGGAYHWFFPSGTVVTPAGRINDDQRIRLAAGQMAWVPARETRPDPLARPAGPAVVGTLTLTPGRPTRVRIPVTRRVPFRVNEGSERLTLTLYDAVGDVDWIRYGAEADGGSMVREVRWSQTATDRAVVEFLLSAPLWGYRAWWEQDDLLLEFRAPPVIDPRHPLRGRVIVVDPGHPPGGSTGPTGLTEAEANLFIARRLSVMLQAEGATVVSLRPTGEPVGLVERGLRADQAGADLLVSIHNNALPDGVPPGPNSGSSTFYHRPASLPLARAVQAHLVRHLGTGDLGVAQADLAVIRRTGMPAIMTEGLFLMLPEHEAALRTPGGQTRYAEAVRDGVMAFLRSVAGDR